MALTPTTLVGNLTSDPELKYTTSQKAKLTFSIAVNDNYTDASGEKVEKASFFNVVVWGYTAEHAANVLEKGIGVVVVGTLDQRSWEDKDGQKRSTVEVKAQEVGIVCRSIESLERRKANTDGGAQAPKRAKPATAPTPEDEPF
jgi:single-strand DNA-binding protein